MRNGGHQAPQPTVHTRIAGSLVNGDGQPSSLSVPLCLLLVLLSFLRKLKAAGDKPQAY